MKITPTPVTAALAGAFAGVVMPLLWPRLGDDTLDWILAFLLVIAAFVTVGGIIGYVSGRNATKGASP